MTVDLQADVLVQKIKHIMITNNGRTESKATIDEFYQAFCEVLREEIMINWTASLDSIEEKKVRVMNYLSMEYLPGRFLRHNIVNLGSSDLVRLVLKKMDRSYEELLGCEPDAGLGNGGLGRLASCFLDSLATLHYPARGYGLRYQYGIFEQEIWNGIQVEKPDCWLLNTNPWESRRDSLATNVKFGGKALMAKNKHGDQVYLLEGGEEVRAIAYDSPIIGYNTDSRFSVLTLRLWSTKESPRNFQLQKYNAGYLESAVENTSLTDVLYPNDNTELGKRVRLKQEFLLVSASLKDILRRHLRIHGQMANLGDKMRVQINDTHPALSIAELLRTLTKNFDFSWQDAWETCQGCFGYTNHTILKEGLEEWNITRLKDLLPRQYYEIEKINQKLLSDVQKRFPQDPDMGKRVAIIDENQVKMANLAIFGSHRVNGVAQLHTEILKNQLFADFYKMYPEKFVNVTNGVTQRRWLLDANPRLSQFITDRIGPSWITNFLDIQKLRNFAQDPKTIEEFLRIKTECKKDLIDYLNNESTLRDKNGKPISSPIFLNENAIFDVQIKRMHEYKRQLLNALHLIVLMQELQNKERVFAYPRLFIFAGKAAPGYVKAKQIILLISAISRKIMASVDLRDKLGVMFVENYNVSKAEQIIPAADVSEQISLAGWEASGTGNMKLSMNGALTIGTEDGANIEMRQSVTDVWWPFKFGATAEENQKPYKSWDIYIHDLKLKRAIDALKEGVFSENQEEENVFAQIYQDLVENDKYRILQDFDSYYNAQKNVEKLYDNRNLWASYALHNIASMGPFSVDCSIQKYCTEIWGINPLPPDLEVLKKVQEEYSEHDRCRIGAIKN